MGKQNKKLLGSSAMARVKTIDFGLGTPYAGTLPTIGA